jgi:heme A synthase
MSRRIVVRIAALVVVWGLGIAAWGVGVPAWAAVAWGCVGSLLTFASTRVALPEPPTAD